MKVGPTPVVASCVGCFMSISNVPEASFGDRCKSKKI